MKEIYFIDTTIRDGQQSLWAFNMRTGPMLSVAPQIGRAGFDAIELSTPVELVKCVRELREDPWERYRLIARQVPKTPLRSIHGTRSGFEIYPKAIHQLWDTCVAEKGITQVRISDCWNDPSEWSWRVKQARKAGLNPIVNLIYSVSPRHTDDYYAHRAREAASLKPFRLCLKDPGGLLTPERTRTVAPAILKNSGGIPVELHTHCTTGLGSQCALEAIRLGIHLINTAIPPLADDSSNPSLFNVAKNARALGYQPSIDEAALQPVAERLTLVARHEGFPIGAPPEYDHYQYIHQVPGGMISNLRFQLRKVGMEDKLPQTLDEAAHVRAELGYPIMVTPLSQFVGSQAAFNVILGERYKEVTDQVIQYALGLWGKEGAATMDPDIKDKILNRPRARELAQWEPPEPSLEELRRKFGGSSLSDDELLLRFLGGPAEVATMRAAGPARPQVNNGSALIGLLEELTKRKDSRRIYIQKGDLSIRLEKSTSQNY